MTTVTASRGRGRPPKQERSYADTRQALVQSGLELLTKSGFLATGVDAIVKHVQVPKGSFYYYFASKEEYGHSVLDAYNRFFAHKLHKFLSDTRFTPMARLGNFIENAAAGMQKYAWSRGCLVGNLMQESPGLPDSFSEHLRAILQQWQTPVAICLSEARQNGEINPDITAERLAAIFWSGWEGAVMRAKLFHSATPLAEFWQYFSASVGYSAAPLRLTDDNKTNNT